MTYVEQQDKRLCAPNGCTAKSFFGLSAVLNQKAKAYLSSKLQGITCSPRPVCDSWEVRKTTARTGVAFMNLGTGWSFQA